MFVLRDKTRPDSAFVPPSQRNDQIHDSCVMTYLFNKIQQVEPVLADDEYQHNGVFKIVRKHEEGPPSQPPITISFFFFSLCFPPVGPRENDFRRDPCGSVVGRDLAHPLRAAGAP